MCFPKRDKFTTKKSSGFKWGKGLSVAADGNILGQEEGTKREM